MADENQTLPVVLDASLQVGARRVDYCRYGTGSARVLFEYGTPGTRRQSAQLIAAAGRADAQLLVIDRPGYGATTRHAGRSVVDVVADVEAVTTELGWTHFAVWGGSGGAPHALALAARLPELVTACASVVGPAPFDAPGLDWFAGMTATNVEEFTLATHGEAAYRPMVEALARDAVAAVAAGGVQVAPHYQLADVDLQALQARRAEPDYLDRMRATYTDGVDGCIDDSIALTRPWGFALADIHVPTSVWYGPEDVLAPRAHAEHLISAIPLCERRELHGGHVLSDADLDRIYHWLTTTPAA